jgi:hypothetical protein
MALAELGVRTQVALLKARQLRLATGQPAARLPGCIFDRLAVAQPD